MLSESALENFVALIKNVEERGPLQPEDSPESALRAQEGPGGLYRAELAKLWRSLRIACVAGDTPQTSVQVLDRIVGELIEEEQRCYVPLTCSDAWMRAIRWAMTRIEPSVAAFRHNRQFQVGMACQRLRQRGYHVDIGAHGPRLDDETQATIANKISLLILQAGGANVANRICAFMRESNALHDGLWLLGNRVVDTGDIRPPAPPIGWLFSLAIRHIHRKPSSRKFQVTLQAAESLAVDVAACLDCQRYTQFEELNLHATDFLRVLAESLTWRELFSLPQVPPRTLTILRQALSMVKWPNGAGELRHEVDRLFTELDHLLSVLSDDCLTKIPQQTAREQYPALWRHARAETGQANANYLGPLEASKRNHETFVFFETTDGDVLTLPRAMTAAAACEVIFGQIWSTIPARAFRVVGDTLEQSIALACRGKADSIYQGVRYRAADGKHLEIDVATRTGQQVVLFETKAKSLTRASRSGNLIAFLDDYTKSYLSLLKQLFRHDRHLKNNLTPLTEAGEDVDAISVMKVAVSPLSYGPVSDKFMANILLTSIAQARLVHASPDPKLARILNEFNKTMDEIMPDLMEAEAPRNAEVDLFGYMLDVVWLDLGQLLYVLDRGLSVEKGLSAFKHLTFATRDFWTEVAFADQRQITAGEWHPFQRVN